MGTIGSGIAARIVGIQEATWGVAPSLASAISWEFKNESLELKKTTVQGQGLHAGGLYDRAARRVLTNFDVGGGIVMDLPARRLNLLLKHMFGSVGQTNATLTQIAATGVYKATHIPGGMNGNSLTIQKGVPATDGTVYPFTYVGCKITDWEISVDTGAIAQLTLNFDGRNELAGAGNSDPLNGSVPGLATWAGTSMDLFHFKEASLITGTPSTTTGVTSLTSPSTLGSIRSASVKHSIAIDQARYFLGSAGFKSEQLENGFRSISGSFTIDWINGEAQYNAFAADTPLAIQLSFIGPNIGSGPPHAEELDILVSNIKLDGESPKVGGPEIVQQSVAFTGLDDEVNNQIQAQYFTLDSAD